MTNQVKIKVTDSTSTVPFNNTSNAFYDMIISVQNVSVGQTISIYDVEGNLINDKPLTFSYPVKIILKDVPIGSISFSDINSYSVILSYVIKSQPEGIPYIDFINETSVHPSVSETNSEYGAAFTGIPSAGSTTISFATLLENAGITNTDSVISIKAIYYNFIASKTGTYDNIIGTYQGTFADLTFLTDFFSVSVTANDVYNVSINQSVYQYTTGQSGDDTYILVPLPSPIVLMDGYTLYVIDGETSNVSEITILYEVLS